MVTNNQKQSAGEKVGGLQQKQQKSNWRKAAASPLGKNVLREIRHTLSRFIAIFAITALGAGFFAGLKATSPDMMATADKYYTDQNLMDYRLLSTMGFTQDDVEMLRARSDVAAVMPTYSLDMLVDIPEGETVARLSALPEDPSNGNPAYMNRLVLKEGRLPQTAGECVADAALDYKVGDVIRLSSTNSADSLDMMAKRSFRVVGLADSPSYITFQRGNTTVGSGKISFFVYLLPTAFESEYYTEIFIKAEGSAGLSSFSQAYEALTENGVTALEEFGTDRADVRYETVYTDANETLWQAKKDLEAGRSEAEEKLAEAWQKIVDGEAEITSGQKAVNENAEKLADIEIQLKEGETALAAGRSQLAEKQAEYDAGLSQYNTQKALYDTQKAQMDTLAPGVANAGNMLSVLGSLQNTLDPAEVLTFQQTQSDLMQTVYGVAAVLHASGNDAAAAALEGIAGAAASAADLPSAYGALAMLATDVAPGYTYLQLMSDAVAAGQAQLTAALPVLNDAAATLAAGKAALAAGWAQIDSSAARLADGRAQVEEGRIQLASARQKLADARKTLAEGKIEYEKQKAEIEQKFADAQAKIDDGQKQLDDLQPPQWYVFSRDGNPGYSGFTSDTGRIDALAIVIPVFFFLVAALVCLTSMTRMVEEHRTQTGTLKALGYGKFSIAFQYILYAGVASFAGAVVGVIVGGTLFPTTIWNAYRILYIMPDVQLAGNTGLFMVSIGVSVLCTTLATVAACYSELCTEPAQLMRPKAPKAGKRVLLERIKPLWSHMSFSQKVTVRNLFRYKKRFFMTVVGVAGCSALLLTGFGLRDSITGIVSHQFGDVNLYDIAAVLEAPSNEKAKTPLNTLLPKLGDAIYTQETSVDAKSAGGDNAGMTTYLFVGEDPEKLNEFIDFHDRESGEAITFPQGDGVVITEKLAKRLQISTGDTFSVAQPSGEMKKVTVAGVMENYVYNYIYMAPATYEKIFGEQPEYTNLLLRLSNDGTISTQETLTALVDAKGVAGAMDVNTLKSQLDDMMDSLNAVVLLIIISAGALAFVVLYNLTNINITERAREIATLKVLGFYDGEVASYVYRENLLLTAIGIAVGLIGGVFLHRFVITTAEIDEVMFRRVVLPLSYVWSILFTMLSAGLVNLVMLRRLRKIDMVESLKSAE